MEALLENLEQPGVDTRIQTVADTRHRGHHCEKCQAATPFHFAGCPYDFRFETIIAIALEAYARQPA